MLKTFRNTIFKCIDQSSCTSSNGFARRFDVILWYIMSKNTWFLQIYQGSKSVLKILKVQENSALSTNFTSFFKGWVIGVEHCGSIAKETIWICGRGSLKFVINRYSGLDFIGLLVTPVTSQRIGQLTHGWAICWILLTSVAPIN